MRRRKLIFGLICVFALFFVFSFFFVEKNLSHECHSVECEVCEQVLICEKKINELILSSTDNNNLNSSKFISKTNNEFNLDYLFENQTLISLNIELLD